jgi:DNA-binding transcriptional MerR regulator
MASHRHHISIAEISEKTGISQAALRMWEKRYGWPKPQRNSSGYRIYSPELVTDVARLATLISKGFSVGEIIRDGTPHWPNALAQKPERKSYDFSRVPLPRTSEGRRVRARLEEALAVGDQGTIAWANAQLPLLHPLDRGPAVLDVLKTAGL